MRLTTALLLTAACAGALCLLLGPLRPGRRPTRRPTAGDRAQRELAAEQGQRFIRPAGAEATHDKAQDWDAVDQAGDESFPSSDPPAFSTPRA
jgi:hypothetical protein